MQSKSLESLNVKVNVQENGRFLRNVLRANAIFSTVSGLVAIFFAEAIANLIGLENASLLVGLGVALFPFAFYVYKVATMEVLNAKLVWVIIEMDVLWVGGSAILLLSSFVPLTTVGKWSIGFLAEIVAVFAVLEYVGLRKTRKE